MARENQQRAYRMDLSDFYRYLGDKADELDRSYQEIEEIQQEFRRIFDRELEAWQERFSYCYPRLLAQREEMPAPFQAYIDGIEEEERQRIRQEMADLRQEIAQARETMDSQIAGAQAATKALKASNPELNEEEEALKARIARLQNEYTQAYEEEDRLRSAPLGGIKNMGRIRRLNRVQKRAKEQQHAAMEQLRQVRQQWLDKVTETGETQSELRKTWQEASIASSQAQARLDHLTENFDEVVENEALKRVLRELDHDPEVPGELGQKLAELAEHNRIRTQYEGGLTSVAEAQGLLKGIGQGLRRFRESVGNVLGEQRRYNLSRVNVQVPAEVVAINGIWADLRKAVKDEDWMGKNPMAFSQIVDDQVSQRLTDDVIKHFFESMGEALNRATEAWG